MSTATLDHRPAAPDTGATQEPEGLDEHGLPVLRLVPVPASEPPYDDELPEPPALRLLPPFRPGALAPALAPAGPVTPRDGGTGFAPAAAPPPVDEDADDDALTAADLLARRTPTSALPSPHRFAHALVQRVVEVRAGVRPLSQLRRDVDLGVLAQLERLDRARLTTPRPSARRPSPHAVRSVHVQARPEGIAEVCATVAHGDRRLAVALRLEGRDGAWCCTALVGV